MKIALLFLLFVPEPLVQQIANSGRCVEVGDSPDARVSREIKIAPGPPPLLSFRYYEGRLHHRFGNAELMLDDAGH
ncbi:MAG: hypothetical protein JO211_08935 [Acidobacteriaceae bacterium]|nr:hypothetical protein [Acidobacteriaceae bacterium]